MSVRLPAAPLLTARRCAQQRGIAVIIGALSWRQFASSYPEVPALQFRKPDRITSRLQACDFNVSAPLHACCKRRCGRCGSTCGRSAASTSTAAPMCCARRSAPSKTCRHAAGNTSLHILRNQPGHLQRSAVVPQTIHMIKLADGGQARQSVIARASLIAPHLRCRSTRASTGRGWARWRRGCAMMLCGRPGPWAATSW